jgi:reactive intermediate/imine deaminase
MRHAINTEQAPAAIGSYSQAIKAGDTFYLSGQIGLDPASQTMVSGGAPAELKQIFENMQAVAKACDGTLDDVVKVNVYLMDMADISHVNEAMMTYLSKPFPARTTLAVSALPKGAKVEIEAIMVLNLNFPAR